MLTYPRSFIPTRYVQWSVTTPTMLWTLAHISSLTRLEVACTVAADWAMVVLGLGAVLVEHVVVECEWGCCELFFCVNFERRFCCLGEGILCLVDSSYATCMLLHALAWGACSSTRPLAACWLPCVHVLCPCPCCSMELDQMLTSVVVPRHPPISRTGLLFWASSACMCFVLLQMFRMFQSAAAECPHAHARLQLWITFGFSLFVWNLFPVAWALARMPGWQHWGEPLTLLANFCAKGVFSSCLVFNNFVTLSERRLRAQREREQQGRLQVREWGRLSCRRSSGFATDMIL